MNSRRPASLWPKRDDANSESLLDGVFFSPPPIFFFFFLRRQYAVPVVSPMSSRELWTQKETGNRLTPPSPSFPAPLLTAYRQSGSTRVATGFPSSFSCFKHGGGGKKWNFFFFFPGHWITDGRREGYELMRFFSSPSFSSGNAGVQEGIGRLSTFSLFPLEER